jgi:hypothetical protein
MIPKNFNIFGQTIKVLYKKTLHKTHDAIGLWFPNTNTIHIQQNTKEYEINKDNIEQTFCHELIHCMLEKIGRTDLSSDEKLVDNLGQVLHQFIKENYNLK